MVDAENPVFPEISADYFVRRIFGGEGTRIPPKKAKSVESALKSSISKKSASNHPQDGISPGFGTRFSAENPGFRQISADPPRTRIFRRSRPPQLRRRPKNSIITSNRHFAREGVPGARLPAMRGIVHRAAPPAREGASVTAGREPAEVHLTTENKTTENKGFENSGENAEFRRITIYDDIDRADLFGSMDSHLDLISQGAGVEIFQRDNELLIRGENVELAAGIIEELMDILRTGDHLDKQKVGYVIALKKEGTSYNDSDISRDIICFTSKGRPLKAKTVGQKKYVDAIRKNDVVFGIGPAGTGKTYLAVAMAVTAFKNKEVQKIVLARPAVEAGENLGFLPGDLQDKVDPYLRPLYDALYDILGRDNALRLKEKETIEVVPLAYMRGRTLDNAFIILDEAQNTTREQMKMFLTRMGFGSKVVVTGDVTQIDLPRGRKSGLVEAEKILKKVEGIEFCYLREVDVIRHEMVKRIISAYDQYEKKHPEESEERGARRGVYTRGNGGNNNNNNNWNRRDR